jgi:hypothetical protein
VGPILASKTLPVLAVLPPRRRDAAVTLVAFDLIELDGRDLRQELIEHRKTELARVLDGCRPGLVVNAVFNEPGASCSNTHAPSDARAR